eukprot:5025504-Prymnesium_polylepis.1
MKQALAQGTFPIMVGNTKITMKAKLIKDNVPLLVGQNHMGQYLVNVLQKEDSKGKNYRQLSSSKWKFRVNLSNEFPHPATKCNSFQIE